MSISDTRRPHKHELSRQKKSNKYCEFILDDNKKVEEAKQRMQDMYETDVTKMSESVIRMNIQSLIRNALFDGKGEITILTELANTFSKSPFYPRLSKFFSVWIAEASKKILPDNKTQEDDNEER